MEVEEIRRLAVVAYSAYGAITNYKNFRGDPMPEFEDLPPQIIAAWMAAVGAVAKEVTTSPQL